MNQRPVETGPKMFIRSFFSLMILGVLSGTALADAKRAKIWFNRLCSQCHGDAGEGRAELGAPAIAGMSQWYVDAQVRNFINGGRGKHHKDWAGMRMRPMAKMLRSDEEIGAVSAYVAGLKPVYPKPTIKGKVLRGQKQYQMVCVACHGADAKGMEVLKAPALVGQNDWYLLTQLKHFKEDIRGYDPNVDPTGYSMRGMSKALTEEQMRDLVAYINVLTEQEATGKGGDNASR